MTNFLTFIDECDRLKDMFTVTIVESAKKKDTEKESEEDTGESDADTEESENTEGTDTEDTGKDDGAADTGLDDFAAGIDGESNSESDESLGETPVDSGDDVNASPDTGKKDGVSGIDVDDLHKELTEGDDTIYDRVAKVAQSRKNMKMTGEEIKKTVSKGISIYMKNKGYGVITGKDPKESPEDLKGRLVEEISKEIVDKADPNRKKGEGQQSKNECVQYYYKRTPEPIKDALNEGVFDYVKSLGLAGAIAAAPMAHAATAESAPDYDNGKQTEITVDQQQNKQAPKKVEKSDKKKQDVRCTEQSGPDNEKSTFNVTLPTEKEVHQFVDKAADKTINGIFKGAHAGWHGLKGLIKGAKEGWDRGTEHNRVAHEDK